jgi:hypothetical protein
MYQTVGKLNVANGSSINLENPMNQALHTRCGVARFIIFSGGKVSVDTEVGLAFVSLSHRLTRLLPELTTTGRRAPAALPAWLSSLHALGGRRTRDLSGLLS